MPVNPKAALRRTRSPALPSRGHCKALSVSDLHEVNLLAPLLGQSGSYPGRTILVLFLQTCDPLSLLSLFLYLVTWDIKPAGFVFVVEEEVCSSTTLICELTTNTAAFQH